MYRPLLTVLASLTLLGCSTIDIQNVEPEKLTIDVRVEQTPQSTQLDVFLKRGIFAQPVSLAGSVAEVTEENGRINALVPARKDGRYGFRTNSPSALAELQIENVGHVDFPFMTPVTIEGKEQFEDQLFFKDDVITIELQNSRANERFLIATGFCGSNQYTTEQRISLNNNVVSIELGRLMKRINNAAEADLNGIIPINLAIEERYFPVWPAPFEPELLASRDETQFSIDTSGFRFKAKIQIEVVESVFFSFTNQDWPVQYCF